MIDKTQNSHWEYFEHKADIDIRGIATYAGRVLQTCPACYFASLSGLPRLKKVREVPARVEFLSASGRSWCFLLLPHTEPK